MSTKFSVFCERIMEAGWLIAAISVPLFFDIYSSRVFEPDKITLIRSLALVVALAWLAKFIETGFADFQGGSFFKRLREANPLTIPVLLVVLIYLISTVLSVAGYVSIWGSYQRLQGTYSFLSYVTISAAMLHALKTRAQVERLLTVIVLVSLPVSAYGWIQHFRLDPLPWGGDVSDRIASSMGNSIFVGAYLIMAFPITLGRWLNIVSQVLREPEKENSANGEIVAAPSKLTLARPAPDKQATDTPYLVLAGCYTFIIAFQALAIFWTFSRGSWIGLLAGMFVFLFLFGVRRRSLWIWGGSLTAAVLGIAFLLAINLPNTPFSSFKTIPGIGRLGSIFDETQGTNQVRFLIWQGAAELVAPHDPIGFGPYIDPFNLIRPLIGYGPESMYVAYNRFYPPDLAHLEARNASPDRSHNETFDSLVNTGLLGFATYITLFGSVFYYGFKWLGLAGDKRDPYLFSMFWILGGAAGAATAYLIDGQPRFIGVAMPVGLLFGLLVYLISQALIFKRHAKMPAMNEDQILLMALIAAIIGHFAEIHFGIAIGSTRTYFWIYIALLVLLGYRLRQSAIARAPINLEIARPARIADRIAAFTAWLRPTAPALATASAASGTAAALPRHFARKRRREKVSASRNGSGTIALARTAPGMTPWANSVIVYGLILGVILQIMVFNFVSPNLGTSPNNVWIYSLFAFTLLVGSLAMTAQVMAQNNAGDSFGTWIQRYVLIAVIALSVMAAYALVHLPRLVPRPGLNAVETITVVADTITVFYVFLFVALLLLATFLMQENALPTLALREPFYMIIYAVLFFVALIGVKTTNLDSIRADIFYKQGLNFDGNRQWDGSIVMYREAINLAPDQDFYYLFYGRAFLEKAKTIADPRQRLELLETSKTQLIRARDLNPLNTDHTANLARLSRTWAEVTADAAQRNQYLTESAAYYEQSLILSPHNAQLHNELGSVYGLMGQIDKALAAYKHSLTVDEEFSQTYLLMGDLYLNQSDYENAANSYKLALKWDGTLIQAHSALGLVYSRQNKYDEAISENMIVLAQQPGDLSSLRNLAVLYQQKDQLPEALLYAQRALAVAPEADKPSLNAFIAQVQAQLVQPK